MPTLAKPYTEPFGVIRQDPIDHHPHCHRTRGRLRLACASGKLAQPHAHQCGPELERIADSVWSHHEWGESLLNSFHEDAPFDSQAPTQASNLRVQFGGHAVFPSLARDMKKPQDFNRVCNLAFVVATAVYLFMGVVGYLM